MADPAGEADRGTLRLDFDRRLMLQFRGSTITSDAGLLAYRELDDTLGLTDTGADTLADARTGKNGCHRLAGLLRQSVFGRLAGYEGLSRPENLAALADLPGQWIAKVHQRRPLRIVVLDMDSSESPTYGEQEGSAYNGHFGCTCYHPLFVFNQLGDVEGCALRPGNVHSADGWRAVLEPVVAHYRGTVKRLYFRGDAAFANPEIYEFLEAEGIRYTIRLPANRILQDRIGYLLRRPVGRPPHEVRRYYGCFSYQAKSWKKARRVVAKVEWPPGELYPRVGFIVTNLARPAERVIAFYNQRGTCEQCWCGRPPRHRLCQNEVVANLRRWGPSVEQISRIGMDTSKHFFQLHGVNAADQPVLRKKLRRKDMVAFFEKLSPTVIGV